jgi:hypothetical protein
VTSGALWSRPALGRYHQPRDPFDRALFLDLYFLMMVGGQNKAEHGTAASGLIPGNRHGLASDRKTCEDPEHDCLAHSAAARTLWRPALPDPIALRCGAGSMPFGNRSEVGALKYYSGRMWYRRTERLTNEQIEGQVILDLGKVVFITRFPITIKPRQVIIKAIRYPD